MRIVTGPSSAQNARALVSFEPLTGNAQPCGARSTLAPILASPAEPIRLCRRRHVERWSEFCFRCWSAVSAASDCECRGGLPAAEDAPPPPAV